MRSADQGASSLISSPVGDPAFANANGMCILEFCRYFIERKGEGEVKTVQERTEHF